MDSTLGLWSWRSAALIALGGHRWLIAGAAIMALLAVAGCSGGSGGETGRPGSTGSASPSSPVFPTGGKIIVTVKDELGAPVAGARARLWGSRTVETTTDANGRIEVNDFPGGASVAVSVWGSDSYGYGADKSVIVGGVVQFDITVFPWVQPTGGVVGVAFRESAQADGKSLEFTLRFAESPVVTIGHWPAALAVLSPNSCTPNPGNDTPRFTPDCIGNAQGFDAPYTVDDGGGALETSTAPGVTPAPLAVALLLDQGARIIVNDPGNARLRGARAFLGQLSARDSVVLGAFAAAGNDAQQPALLPRTPVTIFPADDPRFTSEAGAYLSTLDALAAMAGGASPLHESLDAMIEFVATHAPAHARRSVVVLTDGYDDFCGTADQCHAAVQALIQKARSNSVRIVTVGLAGATGGLNQVALGALAQGTDGIAFQASYPGQLVSIFHSLPNLLNGSSTTYLATYRIQSPAAGALASGRTVLGKVRLLTCSFDCDYPATDIPFAIQVP